jgi:predicted  nucleic acid-binding Zn-ribbon protein
MEKLSMRKQLNIIRLYFNGLSYREIAAKVAVSVGAVTNIIADLKAGNYPEISEASEQVDMLRELAAEVRKSRLTVGEAVTGITVVNSMKEIGLEPGDIPQYISLCKALTPQGAETQAFVKAAMEYREILQRSGLSVDEMEMKVKSLEEASSQLEPMAKKALDLQGELEELGAKKRFLTDEVAELERRQRMLTDSVKEKEQREGALSTRIAHLEETLQSNDEKLAAARKDLRILSSIGMPFDELSGFTERLKGVAHRHDIKPKALCSRLLTELEQLDKGLGLEVLVQTRQRALDKIEGAIVKAQEKFAVLSNENQQLEQELSSLKTQIVEERNCLANELRGINAIAQSTIATLREELSNGIQEGIEEVAGLKTKAIELGQEIGWFDAAVEANEWIKKLFSLARGDDVNASDVRVIGLMLLRAMSSWLDRNYGSDTSTYLLKGTIGSAVSQLERWKVPESSVKV